MKNYFYLFIAIVLLSACKSGSFLSQRYTHFGHASSKKSNHIATVAQQAVREVPVLQPVHPATDKKEMTPQTLVAVAESNKAADKAVASVSNKYKPALKIKDLGRMVAKHNKQAKTMFRKKGTAEVAATHRGLLSSLVGLIVGIVILAIVVAAVILIVVIVI